MARFNLSDEEWAVIEPLLPQGGRGPRRKDDRTVLNGIFYILRTGAPWRDLPERYGPYTTVYNRYNRWGERGVWKGTYSVCSFLRCGVYSASANRSADLISKYDE